MPTGGATLEAAGLPSTSFSSTKRRLNRWKNHLEEPLGAGCLLSSGGSCGVLCMAVSCAHTSATLFGGVRANVRAPSDLVVKPRCKTATQRRRQCFREQHVTVQRLQQENHLHHDLAEYAVFPYTSTHATHCNYTSKYPARAIGWCATQCALLQLA
jgi:hypothetical protein